MIQAVRAKAICAPRVLRDPVTQNSPCVPFDESPENRANIRNNLGFSLQPFARAALFSKLQPPLPIFDASNQK
jgi:hypothetical protein